MRIYSKASTTKANYSINNENQVEALRVANLFFPERDIFMILCDTVGSVIFMQKNLNWMWIMLAAPLYIGNSEPFERRSTLSLFSQPTRRRFGFQTSPARFFLRIPASPSRLQQHATPSQNENKKTTSSVPCRSEWFHRHHDRCIFCIRDPSNEHPLKYKSKSRIHASHTKSNRKPRIRIQSCSTLLCARCSSR